jgi:uncharacterized protein with PQ loop repeat
MYVVAFAAPFFTVPQFVEIWTTKNTSGLSLVTWAAYTVVSFLWLLYWKEHEEKWILISQSLIVLLNAGILAGILLY